MGERHVARLVIMTGFIGSTVRKMVKIREYLASYPRDWVETDDVGVFLKTPRWPLRPRQAYISWEDVRTIHACLHDWWNRHRVGLVFNGEEDGRIIAYEDMKGWESLYSNVAARFAGFNESNYKEIVKCFPGEVWFPCWKYGERVGNLKAYPDRRVVLWEEDGTIFIAGDKRD